MIGENPAFYSTSDVVHPPSGDTPKNWQREDNN